VALGNVSCGSFVQFMEGQSQPKADCGIRYGPEKVETIKHVDIFSPIFFKLTTIVLIPLTMWFSVFTLCGAIAIATVTALPSINPGCKADAILLDILSAVDPIGASKFCSSFILQTTTVISTSLTVQQILTLSTAPDVQTTTTATDILTTTVTSTSSTTLPNPTVTQ
jgi:hypothetical protein